MIPTWLAVHRGVDAQIPLGRDDKWRPAIVLGISEDHQSAWIIYGTGTERNEPHVRVDPHTREGRAFGGINKPTWFYARNCVEQPLEGLRERQGERWAGSVLPIVRFAIHRMLIEEGIRSPFIEDNPPPE